MSEEAVEILLVEDSEDDAEFFARTFRKSQLSARIHVARDGEEALDYIFCTGNHAGRHVSQKPKVIFLDLKLPKVNGLEVLRRLKADGETRTIPVVALTSSQEERDLVESYRLGVNSYIVKPMEFDRFDESVRLISKYWLQFNETPRP